MTTMIRGLSINVWSPSMAMLNVTQSNAGLQTQARGWIRVNNLGTTSSLASPLFKPSPGTHYQAGVLAELKDSQFVFGLTSYLGQGHQGIAGAIAQELGAIKMLHWSGELQLHQGRSDGALPVLRAVNPSSGYAQQDDVMLGDNPLAVFEALFSCPHTLPFQRDPNMDFVKFDKKHPSLHSVIDHVFGHDSPRHGFRNSLFWFGAFLMEYSGSGELQASLNSLKDKPLEFEKFKAAIAILLQQQDVGSQSVHEPCKRLLNWIENVSKRNDKVEEFDADSILQDLASVERIFKHEELLGQYDLLVLDSYVAARIHSTP